MTQMTVRTISDLPGGRVIPFPSRSADHPEAPFEGKWPAWKVATGVILFCGAFWWGTISLVARIAEVFVG